MHTWVDHTSEVELEIHAADERGVFEDALAALAELLGFGEPSESARPTERRTLNLAAGDRSSLLAAWLEELVFIAERDGFVATGIERLELTAASLDATVTGFLNAPPPLVKAVTYHRLAFNSTEGGYFATVVLDV